MTIINCSSRSKAYLATVFGDARPTFPTSTRTFEPLPGLFDYQQAIAALAIRKKKFAAFIACGFGKTLVGGEFIRHAAANLKAKQCALWVSPLMVIKQTLTEFKHFYGDGLQVTQVRASELNDWLKTSRLARSAR